MSGNAKGVILEDEQGNAIGTVANPFPLPEDAATETTVGHRFSGGKDTRAFVLTSSGNTTLYTPTSGSRVTLYWAYFNASQNNISEVLVTLSLGAKVPYKQYMGNPMSFGHWEPIDGLTDEAIVANLSIAASTGIIVMITFKEFAP